MPCQLSRMWRLKGRWVVGGEVYANCKQVPFCSSKLYKSGNIREAIKDRDPPNLCNDEMKDIKGFGLVWQLVE